MSTKARPIVAVVGPTATGKTRLAISLARRFDGEIVNADSRQVYRSMDIGTAKPTREEQGQAPHHLLDILDPDQSLDLGTFLPLIKSAIENIGQRGRLPIVVGGSGQYVWALLEGWQVPNVAPDPAFREAKLRQAESQGSQALYEELRAVDPARAAKLDPRNLRRVIRALEIFHVTGQRPSQFQHKGKPLSDALIIGLNMERTKLYQRIDERVDRMIARGLLKEARQLKEMGYELGRGPLAGPGYREMGLHLAEQVTLDEATQRTKFQTHRLARHQYAWFKLADPRIVWFDASDPDLEQQASDQVARFSSGHSPVIK